MEPRLSKPPYNTISTIEEMAKELRSVLLHASVEVATCRILNLTNTAGLRPDKSLGIERVVFLKMLAVPTEFLNLIVP